MSKKQRKDSKNANEGYQDLSEERRTESVNMLVDDIEIFLKKTKTKSVDMVPNNTKIFLKKKSKVYMSIEKIILECEKIKTG